MISKDKKIKENLKTKASQDTDIHAVSKFNYPKCHIALQHNNQFLNLICLTKNCKKKGLICSICRDTDHKEHQVVSLRGLYAELIKNYKRQFEYQTIESITQELQTTYNNILYDLQNTIQQIATRVKQIEQQIIKQYNSLKQKLTIEVQNSNIVNSALQKILEAGSNVKLMIQPMQQLVDIINYHPDKKQLQIPQIKSDNVVKEYAFKKITINKFLANFDEKFKTQFQTLKTIITQKEKTQILSKKQTTDKNIFNNFQYQFSNLLKGSSISITPSNAKQTVTGSKETRFAIIDPALNLIKNSKIKIKILKCENWIGIGLCFRQIIQLKGYKFDYNKIGHGSYLISSNGYSWSHSRKEDNIKIQNLTFTTGSVISIEFDPHKKKINFDGEGKLLSLNIDIDKNQIPLLNFCVNLCSKNDEVQIINQNQI